MRPEAAISVAFALAAAPATAAPRVIAEPDRVLLGDDREVILRVWPDGDAPVAAAASSGALSGPEDDGEALVFRWTPPDIRHPAFAVLLFWQPAPDAARTTAVRLPLVGRTTLEMDTEPDASVLVKVGDDSFGPVSADRRGRVAVPIRVPPGARQAVVTATAKGREATRRVDLAVPDPSAWVAALGPEPLPQEGGWLAVAAVGGEAHRAKVRAEGAEVSAPTSEDEVARFRVTPRRGPDESVELRVSLGEGEERALTAQVAAGAWTPPAPRARTSARDRLTLRALGGAFDAGGANRGPSLEVAVAIPLGSARGLFAEASAGFRSASLTGGPDGGGDAALLSFPVSAGLRYRAFARSAFAIDLRTGIGLAPFWHRAQPSAGSAFSEGGVGMDAYAGAQGRYALGAFEVALELRGAFTAARTPHLEAHPGGASILAGVGWTP